MHDIARVVAVLASDYPVTYNKILQVLMGESYSTPELTAESLKKLEQKFVSEMGEMQAEDFSKRRVFIAVALLNFVPGKIVGHSNHKSQIIKLLSSQLGRTHQLISHDASIAKAWYRIYPDFRTEVDAVYNKLCKS